MGAACGDGPREEAGFGPGVALVKKDGSGQPPSQPRGCLGPSPCPEQVYPGQASVAWAGHLSSVIVTAGLPFWPFSCSHSYAGSLWLKDYDSERVC